jgi:hypothetical protein
MLRGPGPNRYVPQELILSGLFARFKNTLPPRVLSNPLLSVRSLLDVRDGEVSGPKRRCPQRNTTKAPLATIVE